MVYRKKGGKIVEGLETYPSKAAMKKHEKLESPVVEKQEETMAKSMMKRAKGGKMSMEKWEASARDLAEDKKLAKKRGMSLEAWEKSNADKKHDRQQSMAGLKKGGSMKLPMVPLQIDMAEKNPTKGGNLNAGTGGSPPALKVKGREGKLYSKGGKLGAAPQGKLYQSGGYLGPTTKGRPMAKGGKTCANRLY